MIDFAVLRGASSGWSARQGLQPDTAAPSERIRPAARAGLPAFPPKKQALDSLILMCRRIAPARFPT